jgi:probable F420-dependent oxidoreductase
VSMRVGVLVTEPFSSGSDWAAFARDVERSGFSSLLLPDHLEGREPAPFTALGWAAAATTSLNVGPLMLNNELRHPVLVAHEAMSLHQLSGGRIELGVGAGWLDVDFAAVGLTKEPPGRRIRRLGESVEVIRQLIADAPMRLVLGGGGPRMLALAGEKADIVSINPQLASGVLGVAAYADSSFETLANQVERIDAAATGRPSPPERQLMINYLGIDAHASAAREAFAERARLSPEDIDNCPHVIFGDAEFVVARLRWLHERFGIGYFVIRSSAYDQVAPLLPELIS